MTINERKIISRLFFKALKLFWVGFYIFSSVWPSYDLETQAKIKIIKIAF